jgi:hypothetical protein
VRPPGEVGWKPAEIPDHRHAGLLRARPERPRRSRAAEQRDESASIHGKPLIRSPRRRGRAAWGAPQRPGGVGVNDQLELLYD